MISSHALPNVPGKRVTVVRVSYGPGGFTPPHRHGGSVTAYITKGQVRSQLSGGPLETFEVGQSFFEPPGATRLVSANASNTEPAELIAVLRIDVETVDDNAGPNSARSRELLRLPTDSWVGTGSSALTVYG